MMPIFKVISCLAVFAITSPAFSQEIQVPQHYEFGFAGGLSERNGASLGLSSRDEGVTSRFKRLFAGQSADFGIGINAPTLWNINLSATSGKWVPFVNRDLGLIYGFGSDIDINKMHDRDFNRSTWSAHGTLGLLGGDSDAFTYLLKGSAGIVLIGNDATRGGGLGAAQFEGEGIVSMPALIVGGGIRYCPGEDGISETELRAQATLKLDKALELTEGCTLTVAYSNRDRKEIDGMGLTQRKHLDQLKVTLGYPLK